MPKVSKIAGVIEFREDNQINISAWYGNQVDVDNETPHQRIISSNDGMIIEDRLGAQTTRSQQVVSEPSFFKLSRLEKELAVLSPELVKNLCERAIIIRGGASRILFHYSNSNMLQLQPEATSLKISSFYHTTNNPRQAQPKKLKKQLHFKDVLKQIKENKINPRLKFVDYSAKPVTSAHQSISLLNAKELVKSIVANHQQKGYKEALKDYIKNTLKLNNKSQLLYQTICVPHTHDASFGLHGAGYIKKSPEFFVEELQALKELSQDKGVMQIKLNIPNIKTIEDLRWIKNLIRRQKVTRSPQFQLLMSADLPVVSLQVRQFMDEQIDGFVFDISKAAQMILGSSQSLVSERSLYTDRAILHTLSGLIEATRSRNLPVYVVIPAEKTEIIDKIPEYKHVFLVGK